VVGADGNLTCTDKDNNETKLTVEVNGSKPTSGTITLENGKITTVTGMTLDGKELKKENGKVTIVGDSTEGPVVPPIGVAVTEETRSLAGTVPTGKFNPGDEYIVQVNDTNSYHFYVLSDNNDGTVNLIMDRNICRDGSPVGSSSVCGVAWVSKSDYESASGSGDYGEDGNNNKGPITVMNYIHQATSNWTNIPNIVMNYSDEGYDTRWTTGYGRIITSGTVTTITTVEGEITATYENLKARLPMVFELKNAGCISSSEICPVYLVNGLSSDSAYPMGTKENISSQFGYWTLTHASNYARTASDIVSSGNFSENAVSYVYPGVRPVITVPKSALS